MVSFMGSDRKTGAQSQSAMSAGEYLSAIAALGFSQQGFAKLVGASPRTGQKWGLGETRVPGSVAVLLRLLLARPELVGQIRQDAPPPTRTRADAPAKAKKPANPRKAA